MPGRWNLGTEELQPSGVWASFSCVWRHVWVYRWLQTAQPVCAQLQPGNGKGKEDCEFHWDGTLLSFPWSWPWHEYWEEVSWKKRSRQVLKQMGSNERHRYYSIENSEENWCFGAFPSKFSSLWDKEKAPVSRVPGLFSCQSRMQIWQCSQLSWVHWPNE